MDSELAVQPTLSLSSTLTPLSMPRTPLLSLWDAFRHKSFINLPLFFLYASFSYSFYLSLHTIKSLRNSNLLILSRIQMSGSKRVKVFDEFTDYQIFLRKILKGQQSQSFQIQIQPDALFLPRKQCLIQEAGGMSLTTNNRQKMQKQEGKNSLQERQKQERTGFFRRQNLVLELLSRQASPNLEFQILQLSCLKITCMVCIKKERAVLGNLCPLSMIPCCFFQLCTESYMIVSGESLRL